ncbi:MAG: hypothetical protein KF819_17555 [Labilithrix sp.]|nr:hypothetical protein [Labilithrix sp.]
MKLGLLCAGALSLAACASATDTAGTGAPSSSAPPASRATGEIAAWETEAPMPVARGNHCVVAANGFLVVVGGNHKPKGASAFETVADVHVARIANDGSLGAWTLAGKAPSPVASCTAAASGRDVFLVDGIFEDDAPGDASPRKVRRATLSDEGTLGDWSEIGALPDGVRVLYAHATVSGGALHAFHARLPDAAADPPAGGVALVRAALRDDGSLGAWDQTTWLTGFRGHPQYAFTGGFIYALGGYASAERGNAVLADGAAAAIDPAGAPGASFPVRALPKPTSFGKAIAVDGWVFVIGGKDEIMTGKGRADVFAAKIAESGELGEWTAVAPLPQGRTSHAVAVHGDFVYVVGGGYDGGGLDTVFSARVRFPVSP